MDNAAVRGYDLADMKKALLPLSVAVAFALIFAACGRQPIPAAGSVEATQRVIRSLGQNAVRYNNTLPSPTPIERRRVMERSGQVTVREVVYEAASRSVFGLIADPGGDGPHPGIVLCHPSDSPYRTGLHTQSTAVALAREGFFVLAPDYRGWGRSEGARGNEFHDVVQAIVSLGADDAVDSADIGLIGYSMGGGIAARVALTRPPIRFLALFYPQMTGTIEEYLVYRMTGEWPRGTGALRTLVGASMQAGANPAEIRLAIKQTSPIYHAYRIQVPVAIFHGSDDNVVSIRQSEALARELDSFGLTNEFHEYEGLGHAFANEWGNAADTDLIAFLEEVRDRGE